MKFSLMIVLLLFIITVIPGINAETVPEWVKNTAGWWAADEISEKEFVNAIEFLVKSNIINISSNDKNFNHENIWNEIHNDESLQINEKILCHVTYRGFLLFCNCKLPSTANSIIKNLD